VFPVRYELGFYIPEDGILHSAVKTSNLTQLIIMFVDRKGMSVNNVLDLLQVGTELESLPGDGIS
jgi:hypothetical protein